MNRAAPNMQDFARRLLSCGPNENNSATAQLQAAFSVCEKLHSHLSPMMGNTGVKGLFSRALALAKAETPSLRSVQLTVEGRLDGNGEAERNVGGKELTDGGAVLLAHLLALLVAFIGEKLTLRMVRDALPEWSLNDLDFDTRGKNEKTK